MLSLPIRFSLLAAIALGRASAAELSSTPDRTFVTNGPVQAIVRAGDTIYIGGRFDRVGPRTGPGVEVALDGSQTPGLPEISGSGPSSLIGSGGWLNAVAADGAGGWYIGGLFTHVGGVPRTNLAHIRADRSVDPSFNPDVNDAVYTLAVSGSTVYAAGLGMLFDFLWERAEPMPSGGQKNATPLTNAGVVPAFSSRSVSNRADEIPTARSRRKGQSVPEKTQHKQTSPHDKKDKSHATK